MDMEKRIKLNSSVDKNDCENLSLIFSPEISEMIEGGCKLDPNLEEGSQQAFIENAVRFYYSTISQGLTNSVQLRKKEDIKSIVDDLNGVANKQGQLSEKDSNALDFIDYIVQLWNLQGLSIPDRISIYLRISRISQQLAHLETTYRAEPNGLNLNELQMLLAIRRSGINGRISPSVLKEALLISPSAISKQIERLRKKGFVERITDDEDRRSVWVSLTTEGNKFLNSVSSMKDHTEVIENLTKEEQMVLNQLLRKLLLHLEEYFEGLNSN